MKNLFQRIYLALTILFIMGIVSCNSNPEKSTATDVSSETTITGKIINPADSVVQFDLTSDYLQSPLNQDNSFQFSTDLIDETREIGFIHGPYSGRLYIIPGSNLQITVDFNQFYETIKFEGKAAQENSYLHKLADFESEFSPIGSLISLNEEDFLVEADFMKNVQSDLLNEFKDKIQDKEFVNQQEGNIYYGWVNNLISYSNMQVSINKKTFYKPSDTLQSILNKVPLEKPEYLGSYRYVNYLFDKITQEVTTSLAATTVMKEDMDGIMLTRSLERLMELVDNEEIRKKMVNEFYSYYYSFTKSDVVTLVETNYKTYISESVIQKARKIKEDMSN